MAIQLDNHATPDALPVLDGIFPALASSKEDVDRHGKRHFSALDMHPATPDFIFRNILDKPRQPHRTLPGKQLGGDNDDSARADVKRPSELTRINDLPHGLLPFAVPCMAWIGERIDGVEALAEQRAAA